MGRGERGRERGAFYERRPEALFRRSRRRRRRRRSERQERLTAG
jgi:hypothetical protein